MSAPLTPKQILDLPMEPNDSGATTIRGYLARLAEQVVLEDENFDGKRPFGNSGWFTDLYAPLIRAGAIDGSFDEWGHSELDDYREADALLAAACRAMGGAAL